MPGPPRVAGREWVGVLGGCFDPVHLGHLRLATAVQEAFALRRVLLVPCATPPHKPAAVLSAAPHRLAMLRLAIGDRRGLEVCTLELDRGGVSYTVDTLRELAAGGSVAPLFILGMDSLAEIRTWRDHEALLEEFDVVAADRPGANRPPLQPPVADRLVRVPHRPGAGASLLAGRRAAGGGIYHLLVEPMPVSSSVIRRRARGGEPLDGLVPPAVARYIQSEGLYRKEDHR